MKAGEQQLSGFRRRHGNLHSLPIPHLSQQDHIRALPQGAAERRHIAGAVNMDLPLADDALSVPVDILHRILQRQDMSAAAVIDLIDDAGQRSGFSRACGPCYQHDPLFHIGNLHDLRRNMGLLCRRQAKADHPHYRRNAAPLPEHVDPKASDPAEGKGKIIIRLPAGDAVGLPARQLIHRLGKALRHLGRILSCGLIPHLLPPHLKGQRKTCYHKYI